jgi:hypothetical protein
VGGAENRRVTGVCSRLVNGLWNSHDVRKHLDRELRATKGVE